MNHEIRWHTDAGPIIITIPAKAPLRQVRDFIQVMIVSFVKFRPERKAVRGRGR